MLTQSLAPINGRKMTISNAIPFALDGPIQQSLSIDLFVQYDYFCCCWIFVFLRIVEVHCNRIVAEIQMTRSNSQHVNGILRVCCFLCLIKQSAAPNCRTRQSTLRFACDSFTVLQHSHSAASISSRFFLLLKHMKFPIFSTRLNRQRQNSIAAFRCIMSTMYIDYEYCAIVGSLSLFRISFPFRIESFINRKGSTTRLQNVYWIAGAAVVAEATERTVPRAILQLAFIHLKNQYFSQITKTNTHTTNEHKSNSRNQKNSVCFFSLCSHNSNSFDFCTNKSIIMCEASAIRVFFFFGKTALFVRSLVQISISTDRIVKNAVAIAKRE